MSSPLHWACISHSHVAIEFLLAWGADVNAIDSDELTPLHLTVRGIEDQKDLSTIRKLIFKGANTRARDHLNRTAFDYIENIND